MNNSQLSLYRMENNIYLGDCMVVVYSANEKEMEVDGLTCSDIAIYIKTSKDISAIVSINDFKHVNLFSDNVSAIMRIASECQFGIFGDSHCDCESQRVACLDAINNYGNGIYVQLPQEGQGRGLHYKAQELQLQIHGTTPDGTFVGKKDIYEASKLLTGSSDVDRRSFSVLKKIFSSLNLGNYTYTLISSNPLKVTTLSDELGINIIGARDVKRDININNAGEYLAKIYKKSFTLSDDELISIYDILFKAKHIPERVTSLLKYIGDDIAAGKKFEVSESLLGKIASLASSSRHHAIVDVLDISNEDKYREYQVEIAICDENIATFIDNGIIEGLAEYSYEQNYFYDLVYFKNTVARDLKIRRKSKVGDDSDVVESRLIYKNPVGENEYEIKSVAINDKDIAGLLLNSLEGYEVFYVPVFVHTCINKLYPELLVLIKRYSSSLRTLSIMGPKKQVQAMLKNISSYINIEIIPDPTNIRTINKDLGLDFNYDQLSNEEMSIFNKYHKEIK